MAVLVFTHMVTVVAAFTLTAIDLREHRLPDSITLRVWGLSALATLWLAGPGGAASEAQQAVVSCACAVLGLWLLAELPGQPLGFGDVKLGGVMGMQLGWYSAEVTLLAFVVAFVAGGVFAAIRLVTGALTWRSHIAFGPWLLVGWMAALALSADSMSALGEII